MIRRFTSYTQHIGEKGENIAVTRLTNEGFVVVERNVPNKYGEIDIVAKKKKLFYFYEVKAARAGSWFNPAENMTTAKIRKFLVSVEHYCLVNKIKQYRVGLVVVWICETALEESQVEILPLA